MIPLGFVVMTVEFESMYTNISVQKALQFIQIEWEKFFDDKGESALARGKRVMDSLVAV